MDESGLATPPDDTTTSRGTFASRQAFATLMTPADSSRVTNTPQRKRLAVGYLRKLKSAAVPSSQSMVSGQLSVGRSLRGFEPSGGEGGGGGTFASTNSSATVITPADLSTRWPTPRAKKRLKNGDLRNPKNVPLFAFGRLASREYCQLIAPSRVSK